MIMQKQYDNDGACHNKRNGGKLHGNISRNGYVNAMIGRYGGYFEEDIRRFMYDRVYRITGFGCNGEVCTNSQGEKGQCTVPQRLAKCGSVRVRIIHGLTLFIKNSYTYCKSLIALEAKYYYASSQGKGWQELTIARSRPPLIRKAIKRAPHATNFLHNFYHTCMLRDLPTSTQLFINFKITQLAHF